MIIGAIAALALGAMIGLMSGRNGLGTAVRQLAVAAVAAVTYGVGYLLGYRPAGHRLRDRRLPGGGTPRSPGPAEDLLLGPAHAFC